MNSEHAIRRISQRSSEPGGDLDFLKRALKSWLMTVEYFILNILFDLYIINKCSLSQLKCKFCVQLKSQTRTGQTDWDVGRCVPVCTCCVMSRVRPVRELGQSVQRGAVAVHRPPGGQDTEDVHEETSPHHLPGLQRARTEIFKDTRLYVSFFSYAM